MNVHQQTNTACLACGSVFEVVYDDAGNVTDYRCANTDCPNGRPQPEVIITTYAGDPEPRAGQVITA